MSGRIPDRLTRAVPTLEQERDHEELKTPLARQGHKPDEAAMNHPCVWVHDELGLEADAVSFYQAALETGLEDEDSKNALPGLGSTHCALGRYQDSVHTLDRGVSEVSEDPVTKAFRAMGRYNTRQAKQAREQLLNILATTDQPEPNSVHRNAIAEYADDLDRTWQ